MKKARDHCRKEKKRSMITCREIEHAENPKHHPQHQIEKTRKRDGDQLSHVDYVKTQFNELAFFRDSTTPLPRSSGNIH